MLGNHSELLCCCSGISVVVAHKQAILNQLLFLLLSCSLLLQTNLYQRDQTSSVSLSESVDVLEQQYVFIGLKLKHYVTRFLNSSLIHTPVSVRLCIV